MNEKWKREVFRDSLSLGSWVFYFLVIGRALIGPYRPFVDSVIIAIPMMIVLSLMIKESEGYVTRALVLLVFTIRHYSDLIYSIFAALVFFWIIYSSYYINKNTKKIANGLIIGIISVLAAYILGDFTALKL